MGRAVGNRVVGPAAFADDFLPGRGVTAGRWYGNFGGTGAGAITTLNLLTAIPVLLPAGTRIDRIAFETTTATASATLRVGLYADDGGGYPGALLVDAGAVDCATQAVFTATVDVVHRGGLLWVAAVAQAVAPTIRSVSGQVQPFATFAAGTSLAWFTPNRSSVSGALPDPFGGALGGTTGSLLVVRAA